MDTIWALKITNLRPAPPADRGNRPAHPVSLLTFLQAENLKLQNVVARLERETTALREALQRS